MKLDKTLNSSGMHMGRERMVYFYTEKTIEQYILNKQITYS